MNLKGKLRKNWGANRGSSKNLGAMVHPGLPLEPPLYMLTSGERSRISNEAESAQSVSYTHIRSLSGLHTLVCLREGNRGTCLAATFSGPPSRYFARKYSSLLV